ncbi:MAG: hypothetical protein ACRDSP_23500 [Pseudonocardiaceae bacterium]
MARVGVYDDEAPAETMDEWARQQFAAALVGQPPDKEDPMRETHLTNLTDAGKGVDLSGGSRSAR